MGVGGRGGEEKRHAVCHIPAVIAEAKATR